MPLLIIILDAVNWLCGHMKARYQKMRLKKYKEEKDPWPPFKTKSYVTLALAYQKELQTSEETITTIYLRTKGEIDKIPQMTHAKKLDNIAQIFTAVSDEIPNNILIEGHAGIGKTTLVKEICIEWAQGVLLSAEKLVLLLFLRDSNVQRIGDIQELINHFVKSPNKAEILYTQLEKNYGAGLTLIIDGFDELTTELRHDSFFRRLVEKHELPNAKIVVTSRPSASACLHDIVDRRIEILGFEQSSKKQYVIESLRDSPSKIERLQRHFQQYPNIDAICYIPLIMSIIVFICMCEPDELPSTATKMYASFTLHTICHYLKRNGNIPEDTIISKMEQFPPVVYNAILELEKVALGGLINDKIVFTVEELPILCKHDPTCYGVLQSTEFYSAKEIGTPIKSFNFVHLGIQEYFAAKCITRSPEFKYGLMEQSFITTDGNLDDKSIRFCNVWILYCGITSGKCRTLRHYLNNSYANYDSSSDDVTNVDRGVISHHNFRRDCHISPELPSYTDFPRRDLDIPPKENPLIFYQRVGVSNNEISQGVLKEPMKVLYLFQCFQEAEDKELCEVLSKSFDRDVIDLHNKAMLPHQLVSLGVFLSATHKIWQLNLSNCYIGDHGISILHQSICGGKIHMKVTQKVNLSRNGLTGVSMPFIIDIVNHLQIQTLVLHSNNINNVGNICYTNSAIRILNMEYNSLTVKDAVVLSRMTMVLKELHIADNKFGNHGVELLSMGIKVTKSLNVLDVRYNNVGPLGITAIAEALMHNDSLEKLYVGDNPFERDTAIVIAEAITSNKKLQMLALHLCESIWEEVAMVIVESLHNNNSITKLSFRTFSPWCDVNIQKEIRKINHEREKINVQNLVIEQF